ncbi:hypothetical protein FSP39_011471 [Pinctada imbricata]|uniref:Tyr recombinase domain-containing protein n=1 Tax=Pinctada imbricata TaxID=66713 RepID=A0AA88YQX9_PINIB|nr:hypothetical protein FSP39_011471 [Pinctada imbricata]
METGDNQSFLSLFQIGTVDEIFYSGDQVLNDSENNKKDDQIMIKTEEGEVNFDDLFSDEFVLDGINVSTTHDEAVREMNDALNVTNPPILPEPQHSTSRFKKLTESELDNLEAKRQSESTKRNTKWGVKVFQEWSVHDSGSEVDFHEINSDELNIKLRRFYAEAQPANVSKRANSMSEAQASEYHKNSFKAIRSAINRHLNDLNRDIDIVRDKAFKTANQALDGKLKQNVADGLSRPTKHKDVISTPDLHLINTYLHSDTNPIVLRHKVWYDLSVHFVSRGLELHPQLHMDSFKFMNDETGREYVTLLHDVRQKNHQGGIDFNECSDKRMYSSGDESCPVKSLRELMSRTEEGAISLFNHCVKQALKTPKSMDKWFTTTPVKPYQFSTFMKDISKNAGCSKYYTAHCLRATSIQALSDAGHELRHIMLLTGHRNEASIRSYSRDCSDDQKRSLSNTLSKITSGSTTRSESEVPLPTISQTATSSTAASTSDQLTSGGMAQQPVATFQMSSRNFLSSGFMANSSFERCVFQFHVHQ